MPTTLRLATLLACIALALAAHAQAGDKVVRKEAHDNAKAMRAHTTRRGESMSKEPRLLKQEDRRDHRKGSKPKFKR